MDMKKRKEWVAAWWRENREKQYARRKERREWRGSTPLTGVDLAAYMALVGVAESGCHLWLGTITKVGYGIFQGVGAHRMAYLTWRGEIPQGKQLDHLCRTPACVNPEHLEPVTPLENVQRGVRARMSSECKRGHSWAEHGFVNSQGGRVCRECKREASRRYEGVRGERRKVPVEPYSPATDSS